MVMNKLITKGRYAGEFCRVVKVNPITYKIELIVDGKKIQTIVPSNYISQISK